GSESSLADFRKDVIIDVFNEAGQKVLSYKVFRCWVSEFQALPGLDSNANAVAIQTLKLENEGWIRDTDVAEPKEPTLHSTTWTRWRLHYLEASQLTGPGDGMPPFVR